MQVDWMKTLTLAGVQQILGRLQIVYKRGRQYIHSPDEEYSQKMARIEAIKEQVKKEPKRYVLLYEDELSYYRQPTVAQDYARVGSKSPLAKRSYHSNTYRRLAGCLNASTGQVTAWQRSRFDRFTLLAFFLAVEQAYPHAEIIFVVLDNWPVHFHPDVLAGLAKTKIQLVRLPTYAPWNNPIEKLWRKLYQEVLHLHDQSDDLDTLKDRISTFLEPFVFPSHSLLTYVGLAD